MSRCDGSSWPRSLRRRSPRAVAPGATVPPRHPWRRVRRPRLRRPPPRPSPRAIRPAWSPSNARGSTAGSTRSPGPSQPRCASARRVVAVDLEGHWEACRPPELEPRAVLNTTVPWSTTWFTGKMSGLPSTTTARRPTGDSRSNASDSCVGSSSTAPVAPDTFPVTVRVSSWVAPVSMNPDAQAPSWMTPSATAPPWTGGPGTSPSRPRQFQHPNWCVGTARRRNRNHVVAAAPSASYRRQPAS